MENKEFSKMLEIRIKAFAIRIIKLSAIVPNTVEGRIIRNQLTKAGTSIGANYREANRARSKADFKNKIKICESEASETCYWLEIIQVLDWVENKELEFMLAESNEYWQFSLQSGKALTSKYSGHYGHSRHSRHSRHSKLLK
jgi:four helix bundle protein